MVSPQVCHWWNWEKIGRGYEVFPPSLLHLGKANRPNPCPATPITHRLRTHSPSHTAFIWAWNGFLLSARMHHLSLDVILFHPPTLPPPLPFPAVFSLCHTVALFFPQKKKKKKKNPKNASPTLQSPRNTFPPQFAYDRKWAEIPSEIIFYMTTWIRSKSETHDGPNLFKTNHSHPWNPQEKGMFMKIPSKLAHTHTHTHTHTRTDSVRGCSIKYWYLPPPHDFTCPKAESLFSEEGTEVVQNLVLFQQVMKVKPVPDKSLSRRMAAICQQKLHNSAWFMYFLLFVSHRVRLSDPIIIGDTLFGS